MQDSQGRVGEEDYTRMRAKEFMKKQVGQISRIMCEQQGLQRASASNQAAKNLLQAMSIFSMMSVAVSSGQFSVQMSTYSICKECCVIFTFCSKVLNKKMFVFLITLAMCFGTVTGEEDEEALSRGYGESNTAITLICVFLGLLFFLMRWRESRAITGLREMIPVNSPEQSGEVFHQLNKFGLLRNGTHGEGEQMNQ